MAAETVHDCAHCGHGTVVITRDGVGCTVHCDNCGRHWSYPNSSLSDEIALANYASQLYWTKS